MKTIFTILLLLIFKLSWGQIDFTPYSNYVTHCPGELTLYTSSVTGTDCGQRTWTVTNGKILNSNNQEVTTLVANAVYVRWNDVAGNGKLRVTVTCDEGIYFEEKTFAIRSLKDKDLENARANNSLPYCSTSSVNIQVDQMLLENTGGFTNIIQQYADGYEWELPPGWTSGGHGAGDPFTTGAPIIDIVPSHGCSGGTVKVKAYVNCSSGKKYSKEASISVDRYPAVSTSLGKPANYTGPKCGNTSPVTFTAASFPCAVEYRWTATGTGWKDSAGAPTSWTTATNTLTLYPSGDETDGGIIAVEINMGCGSFTLRQTYHAVYSDPGLAKPTFNHFDNQFILCSNMIAPLSVNAVNGAVSYTWYTVSEHPSYNVLLNGILATQSSPITTTGTQITVQAPVLANGDRFGFSIIVKANRPAGCQGSLLSEFSGWVGAPLQSHYSQIYISGFYGVNPITLAKGALYQFNIEPVDGAISYNWVLPFGFTFMSNQITDIETIHVWTSNQSGTFDIRCYPQGFCGESGTGYSSIYVTLPGAGGGPGGPGCDEPPCIVPQPLSIFPNPAMSQLTVSLPTEQNRLSTTETTEITLYDNFQQKVYSTKTTDMEVLIPTANLPNGIYYLRVNDKNGVTTRQVQIKN